MSKTYAIEVKESVVHSDRNGGTIQSESWKQVMTLPATRQSNALKQAERLLPGKQVRARMVGLNS